MMAFMGVRISWLIIARNALLAWVAAFRYLFGLLPLVPRSRPLGLGAQFGQVWSWLQRSADRRVRSLPWQRLSLKHLFSSGPLLRCSPGTRRIPY
jgi:hypothetical protein